MDQQKYKVPMSSPDLTDEDRQAVMDVLETKFLSMGPRVDAFEDGIREYTGARYSLAVNSGTAGLHLCIRAAGVEAGDLVITTPFSFISSTNVILFEHAIPIFIDVDPLTGNLDTRQTADAVHDLTTGSSVSRKKWIPKNCKSTSGKLKAVLSVDVFGQPADYDTLREICSQNGLSLIEDSCEALGSEYRGVKAGRLGKYGVFAYYPNKQMTTGEGGMVITDDQKASEFMRSLRNQGRAPGDTWLQHTHMGYNYRLDEMSAALGVSQLKRLDELIQKRASIADYYNQNLRTVDGVEIPKIIPETTRMSWFVYVIRLRQGLNRTKVAARMESKGIPVRPYFLPIHLQPYMMKQFGYQAGSFPVTEDLGNCSMALPFSSSMTPHQVDMVCEELVQSIREK
jgi:perosamine synthetase